MSDLDPYFPAPDWRGQNTEQRLWLCKGLLFFHGLLTHEENERITLKLEQWEEAHRRKAGAE